MTFEFRAHKPGAYLWFGFALIIIIFLNVLLVYSLQSMLLNWNSLVQQSVILIVPWLFILFLPSVAAGLIVYASLAKRYRIILKEDTLRLERINRSNTTVISGRTFAWDEVKEFRFSDFEDNEYFTLVFNDPKSNLILHRATGDFELFFEELKKHVR